MATMRSSSADHVAQMVQKKAERQAFLPPSAHLPPPVNETKLPPALGTRLALKKIWEAFFLGGSVVACILAITMVIVPLRMTVEIMAVTTLYTAGAQPWQWALLACSFAGYGPVLCYFAALDRSNTVVAMRPYLFGLFRTTLVLAILPSSVLGCLLVGCIQFALPALSAYRSNAKYSRMAKKGPLRILLVGNSFEPIVDGVATFTTQTIKGLTASGHTVAIATHCPTPSPLHGASVYRLFGFHLKEVNHYLTLPSPALIRALIDFQPDVVHCFEGIVPITGITCLVCDLLNIRYVISMHTRGDLIVRATFPDIPYVADFVASLAVGLVVWLFSITSASHNVVSCMCVSKELLRILVAAGLGEISCLWRSGVDLRGFRPERRSQSQRELLTYGAPELPLVVHSGRLTVEKQSDQLPAIFEAVSRRLGGRVRFAVFGDGMMREQMEVECKNKGLTLWCDGYMFGEALQSSLACGDVFVSACTTEAIGLCLMEAMACGVPVVAPDAGGIGEDGVVVDGLQGHLYKVREQQMGRAAIEDAADCIVRALNDRERLSRNAVEYMASNSWEASISELERMIERTLGREPRPPSSAGCAATRPSHRRQRSGA